MTENKKANLISKPFKMPSFSLVIFIIFISCLMQYGCSTMAASANEYYSIGMAYFELGKFEEAEMWLNRAKQSDKTMAASKYNLGRIAFERKRYDEATGYFEDILKKDPDNVLAIKAAAFSRIKTGDIELAEKHYSKLLALVPESADDGYNYALVLFAMGKHEKAEEMMDKFPFALLENSDIILLYARNQKALNKIEAIDTYARFISANPQDIKVKYEYAQLLEKHELYARSLEEYRNILTNFPASVVEPKKSEVHYALAKLLLIADSESTEGITELEKAVTEGYNNAGLLDELLASGHVSEVNSNSLKMIIEKMRLKAVEDEKQAAVEQKETDSKESDSKNSSKNNTKGSSN